MKMRPILRTSLIAALLLAAGVAGAGDPKTALGKWMKPNMGTPFAQDPPDFATLQTSLALLITKEPPAATYPQWDKFLQQGLAAAKAGGQSRITVVGHTDTSGSAEYNLKLSERRAGVVKDTMVQMGARPEAIQVSGVGETDLAVQTADGVKEARNRRAVITLLP